MRFQGTLQNKKELRMSQDSSVYTKLVAITEDYLGSSAQKLVDLQITNHLHKKPEKVNQNDLYCLNDWLIAVLALLTDDRKKLSEYSRRLSRLIVITEPENNPK